MAARRTLAYQPTVLISAMIARRMASGRVGQADATVANSGSDGIKGCPSGCPEFETCVFSRVFVPFGLGSNPSSPVFSAVLIVPACALMIVEILRIHAGFRYSHLLQGVRISMHLRA